MTFKLSDIKRILKRAKADKDFEFTHVIICYNEDEDKDYPIFVTKEESVREKFNKLVAERIRIMEVYNLNEDLDKQLNLFRSFAF